MYLYIYVYKKCRSSYSDESTEGAQIGATTKRNHKTNKAIKMLHEWEEKEKGDE